MVVLLRARQGVFLRTEQAGGEPNPDSKRGRKVRTQHLTGFPMLVRVIRLAAKEK
jgi:hypothetical protein